MIRTDEANSVDHVYSLTPKKCNSLKTNIQKTGLITKALAKNL